MKALLQRVAKANVIVSGEQISEIGPGLLVLLGVHKNDTHKDADYLVEKIVNLRVFDDPNGKMNISLKNVKGDLMVVSQFTLLGDCRKGRRPSYSKAAGPEKANDLYEYFISRAAESGILAKAGKFQALMEISLVNHGPVTLILDTKETTIR